MLYSPKEEKFNTYTHAPGILFGVIAGIVLVSKAIEAGNGIAAISFGVFGLFMMMMFTTSTLYHAEKNEQRKFQRRKWDHAAIYLQIAGSYTPYTLIVLRNDDAWGWTLFGVIWTAGLLGFLLSFLNLKKGSRLETIAYIAMGWVVVIAFKPLIDTFQATGSMNVLYWLIGGGLFYTVGAVLYQFKKIPYMHGIWHLFVLAGCLCHVIAAYDIHLS